MTRVVVHIDRLVLTGFRPGDRRAIADGLQGELSRSLADPISAQRLANLGHVPSLWADRINLTQNPRATGVASARAIFKGLSR